MVRTAKGRGRSKFLGRNRWQWNCWFLEKNFLPWLEDQSLLRRTSCFQLHQKLSPVSLTSWTEYHGVATKQFRFKPNRKCLGNRQNNYYNGWQYNSYDVLWDEIKKDCSSVILSKVQNLINSVDKRLINVLGFGGNKVDIFLYLKPG